MPLLLTIAGDGGESGKTVIQFLLAEFLSSRGHAVYLSDETSSAAILEGNLRRYGKAGRIDTITPMPIYLHVRNESANEQHEFLAAHSPQNVFNRTLNRIGKLLRVRPVMPNG